MRYLKRIGWGLCWALLAGMIALAQVAANPPLRVIEDPGSGARWVLVKDSEHPGGPGRMVLVQAKGLAGFALNVPEPKVAAPVIRAGDRIVVEEHTDVADAVLEAVALASAVELGPFRAHLRIGGRVVRVIAIAPGRARLPAAGEARP